MNFFLTLFILICIYYIIIKIIGAILYFKFKNIKETYYWNNKIHNLYFNKSIKNTKVIYFIHGYGGAPDQILLNKNIILEKYKNYKIIIKCANHPILSNVNLPIYERYTNETIESFHKMILDDIIKLMNDHNDINIVVSSNGMYDFMSIYNKLNKHMNFTNNIKSITIYWLAMMGNVRTDLITKFLLKILPNYKGSTYVPGNNYLSVINNELSTTFDGYKMNDSLKYEKYTYKKYKIEGRIHFMKHYWSENESIDIVKKRMDSSIKKLGNSKIKIRCIVHIPLKDGYWDANADNAKKILTTYFSNYTAIYCNESHLWSVNNIIISKVLDIGSKLKINKEYNI